jgi:hypothetical protein
VYFTQEVMSDAEEESDEEEEDISIDTSSGKFSKNRILSGVCMMDD